MNDYYVSLVADLLGCYLHFRADDKEAVRLYMQKTYLKDNIWKLHFRADDKEAVRLYMQKTYLKDNIWKLPWCQVYSADELKENGSLGFTSSAPILIEAKCGSLHLADYEYLSRRKA